jgi:glutaminase
VSKPVTAALCLAEEGAAFVEEWVGCEPAKRPFNSQDLMPETNIPYNASMDSGAIMSAGMYASRFPDE